MSFNVRRNVYTVLLFNQTAHATSRNTLRPNYSVKFSRQAEKLIVLCILRHPYELNVPSWLRFFNISNKFVSS